MNLDATPGAHVAQGTDGEEGLERTNGVSRVGYGARRRRLKEQVSRMTRDGEPNTGSFERVESERPMSRGRLGSSDMQIRIAEAERRAARGRKGAGKTADDLLSHASDKQEVDPRARR